MITIRQFTFILAALTLACPVAGQEYLRWGGGPKTPDACLKWATDGSGRVLASGCSTSSAVAANLINAGPTTGGSAVPTFRTLVVSDLPTLPASQISSGVFAPARLGTSSGAGTSFLNGLGAFAALTLADLPSCPTTTAGSVLFRWNGSAIICGGVAGEDVTSGTVAAARIASLDVSKLTSGTFVLSAGRLPVTGNGTTLPTTNGLTNNRCVETDSNGNLVSAAAVCGSGGGGTATAITTSTLAGLPATCAQGDTRDVYTTLGDPTTRLGLYTCVATNTWAPHDAGHPDGSIIYATNASGTRTAQIAPATYMLRASNLSDLPSASTARTNLGLGAAALLPVQGNGTSALTATTITNSRPLCSDANGKAYTPTGTGALQNDCTFAAGSGGASPATALVVEEWIGGRNNTAGTDGLGENSWTRTLCSGAPTFGWVPEAGRPGVLTVTTAASGGIDCAGVQSPNTVVTALNTTAGWTVTSIVKTDSSTTSLALQSTGFGNQTQHALEVAYKPGTSANWLLRTCAAFSCTETDSGVAVATSTWYKFVVDSQVAGTVGISVNGSARVTTAANIPSAAMKAHPIYVETSASAARTVSSDYFAVQFSGLTR